MENDRVLVEGCAQLGIALQEEQVRQFRQYYDLLIEWNSVMNLTAITAFDEVMQKHFVDSLALVKGVSVEESWRVLDVGTGAGFPGIPLKIAFPGLEVVLLDSLNKRVKFLNEVIGKLGLTGISAVHARAEELARKPEYREGFDLVVSRAVANLASLAEYCLPYVKVGGLFVSYKSGSVAEEAKDAQKAIETLGGVQKDLVRFSLPGSEIERSLVVIGKEKGTPKRFPRRPGVPGKEPIR